MNFETVDTLLSGSPLWERIKSDVNDQAARVLAPTHSPTFIDGRPKRYAIAAELYNAGKRHTEIAAAMSLSLGGASKAITYARKLGLITGPRRQPGPRRAA
jgi:hypothetical protein